jgi:hypothetical protein
MWRAHGGVSLETPARGSWHGHVVFACNRGLGLSPSPNPRRTTHTFEFKYILKHI